MKREVNINNLRTKQKQKIKLLVNRPDFQKIVLVLRKKWNIPKDGFQKQEDIDNWNNKLNFDSDKYLEEVLPAKKKDMDKAINDKNTELYFQLRNEFNNNLPRNAFLNDIKKLVHDQRISPRWINGIKRYLLSNNLDNMAIFLGPVIATKVDMELDLETISIEINEDTVLDDIKAIWPEVKERQSELLYKKRDKNQPMKNFERNKKAYKLKQEGKSLKDIAEILSDEYQKDYVYSDAADFIKKYKKIVGIN